MNNVISYRTFAKYAYLRELKKKHGRLLSRAERQFLAKELGYEHPSAS